MILHRIDNPTIPPYGHLSSMVNDKADNPMLAQILAALALAIWLYLLLGRGGFWLSAERDDGELAPVKDWPKLAVVIPARDEAQGIGA
jgi:hypothetical protein